MTGWVGTALRGVRGEQKFGFQSLIGLAMIVGTAYLIYRQFNKASTPPTAVQCNQCAKNIALDVPDDVTLAAKPNDIFSEVNISTDDMIEDAIAIAPVLL